MKISSKPYKRELIQLSGDLDTRTLLFVKINLLNWIGHINRMGGTRIVGQVFNNNPQESRLRRRPKNRWWNCAQTGINKKQE